MRGRYGIKQRYIDEQLHNILLRNLVADDLDCLSLHFNVFEKFLLLLFVCVASGSSPVRTEWAQCEGGLKETGAKRACFRQRLNKGAA